LDGSEFTGPGTIVWIPKHSRSRHLRRNLFEQF
jgi:hypothetical protein